MSHLNNSGRYVLVTPPDPALVMPLATCKAALGITSDDQDGMISAAVGASVAALDPALGGWLGRAIGAQTWELQLSSFLDHRMFWHRYCVSAIVLPYPPLINVTSVKYLDAAGADQTVPLGQAGFRILGLGSMSKQHIAPMYGSAWPTCRVDDASVRIRFTCGYDGTQNKMPPSLSQAIILGTRALLSVTERNLFIAEDQVEGIGTKKYIVGSGAGDVVKDAIGQLLANLQPPAL